jgi:hypothetical protein
MKTYKIVFEPVTINGATYPKYNVYYFHDGKQYTKEFHSTDGVNGTVLPGYTLITE